MIEIGICGSKPRSGNFVKIMSFLKFWVKSKKKKKDLPPEVLADNGSVFLPGKSSRMWGRWRDVRTVRPDAWALSVTGRAYQVRNRWAVGSA